MTEPKVRSKVVIVDDSAFTRERIRRILSLDPRLEVVGTAHNADEARQVIRQLNPDVITLDLELPGMAGLDFLRNLMRLRPTPVVVVSDSSDGNLIQQTIEMGAFSFALKRSLEADICGEKCGELRRKVQAAARRGPFPGQMYFSLVALGASTGGLEVLAQILPQLPAHSPPILLVQHIGAHMTGNLVHRLQERCLLKVQKAEAGQLLENHHLYLGPGGSHLEVSRSRQGWQLQLSPAMAGEQHCPSIDRLFASVAQIAGRRAVGMLLTGMGQDGVQGLQAIKAAGGDTLAQDPDTCAVRSMPEKAIQLGAVRQFLAPSALAQALVESWHRF